MAEAANTHVEVPLEILLGDIDTLRPHLASRRADLDAERYHDRFNIYAIDTNVLYFCAQPLAYVRGGGERDPKKEPSWHRGVRHSGPRVVDLGSVFRSDPPELHGVICTALAHYIGLELGRAPLYVPTAIKPEIGGMYAHFTSFTEELTAFDEVLLGKMSERLQVAIVEHLSAERLFANALDDVSLRESLTRLINVRAGPASGMERLSEFYGAGRIADLAWINPAKLVRGSYNSFDEIGYDYRRTVDALGGQWERELIEVGKVDPAQRRSDAWALAEVEYWNLQASANGGPERLLYLTADKAIHVAAGKRALGSRSFAELYVRHPSAFLEDIIVAARPPATEAQDRTPPTSLLDWIDLLISGYLAPDPNASAGTLLSAKARDVIRDFGREHPGEAGKVRSGWHSLADLREGRLLEELGLSGWLDALIARIASTSGGLNADHLRNELRRSVLMEEARAWESCFKIAAELTMKLDQRQIDIPSRSSPPICFEGWSGAAAAIEQFKFWGYREPFDQSRFEDLTERLLANDHTHYAYYLAFASWFAGRGNWKAAASLSSFTHELAQFSGAESDLGANGREAAFLEAVARRHTAASARQLDRSVEALRACREILTWEIEHQQVEPSLVVPERFDLEDLDLSQTKLLFDLRQEPEPPLDDDQKSMAGRLIGSYRQIQERIARQLDYYMEYRTELPLELGTRANVLLQTELRSIVSACSLFVLGLQSDTGALATVGRLMSRLDEISRRETARSSPNSLRAIDRSFLGTTVIGVSRVLLERSGRGGDKRSSTDDLRELRKVLSKRNIRQHSLFPFDERRFTFMRALLD